MTCQVLTVNQKQNFLLGIFVQAGLGSMNEFWCSRSRSWPGKEILIDFKIIYSLCQYSCVRASSIPDSGSGNNGGIWLPLWIVLTPTDLPTRTTGEQIRIKYCYYSSPLSSQHNNTDCFSTEPDRLLLSILQCQGVKVAQHASPHNVILMCSCQCLFHIYKACVVQG